MSEGHNVSVKLQTTHTVQISATKPGQLDSSAPAWMKAIADWAQSQPTPTSDPALPSDPPPSDHDIDPDDGGLTDQSG